MRPDQTDPGINTTTRDDVTREVPVRTDADGGPLPRRERAGSPSLMERAGSPSPMELEGAASWQDIKSRFVDDPAGAIAAAEELVKLAFERRVRALKDEMSALCARDRDEGSSATEGLRTRLLRYQEYCEQLARTSLH